MKALEPLTSLLAVTITSRGSLIAADILLIAITWVMLGRRTAVSSKSTFSRVILLDGERGLRSEFHR